MENRSLLYELITLSEIRCFSLLPHDGTFIRRECKNFLQTFAENVFLFGKVHQFIEPIDDF